MIDGGTPADGLDRRSRTTRAAQPLACRTPLAHRRARGRLDRHRHWRHLDRTSAPRASTCAASRGAPGQAEPTGAARGRGSPRQARAHRARRQGGGNLLPFRPPSERRPGAQASALETAHAESRTAKAGRESLGRCDRRPDLRMRAVPAEGPAEALAELHSGLPADLGRGSWPSRGTGGRSPRSGSRPRGSRPRSPPGPSSQIRSTTSRTGCGLPQPALNASPPTAAAGERLGDRQIGRGSVLDVEEVPLRRAIGANHRPAPVEHGAHRLGDQAGEVAIAAAVDVGEAGSPRPAGRSVCQ